MKLLFITEIAGAQHTGNAELLAGLPLGEPLDLIAEPENKFDKNAIRVVAESGEKLGYIPASHALAATNANFAIILQKDEKATHIRGAVKIGVYSL